MGLLTFLNRMAGLQDVGRVEIHFRADGDHAIGFGRYDGVPTWLDHVTLRAALWLHYYANSLYALGESFAASQLRMLVPIHVATFREDGTHDPSILSIDHTGVCIGTLQLDSNGALSMVTQFKVPVAETNLYIETSVLMLFTHTLGAMPENCRPAFIDAADAMELFYKRVAEPHTHKALREAGDVGVRCFRQQLTQRGIPEGVRRAR
jgi:hypothetical protein